MAASGIIFKRNDGRWVIKYKGITKYEKSETAAKRTLRSLTLSQQVKISEVQMTVRMLIEQWLYNYLINHIKRSSFDRKESVAKNQVFPLIGDIQVNNLCSEDINDMIKALDSQGYSYSTIKKAYETVNACLNYFVSTEKLHSNPIKGVSLSSAKRKAASDIVYYTEDELSRLIVASRSTFGNGVRRYRNGEIVQLVSNTGLRSCELRGMRWDSIDFKRKQMVVRESVVTTKKRDPDRQTTAGYERTIQSGTKSSSGDRIIPLNNKAIESLEYLKSIANGSPFVVSTQKGKCMNDSQLDKTFANILDYAGFPEDKKYGIHSLRHTFATIALRNGANVKKVSMILGHRDVYVTYNIYVHFIAHDLVDAVSLLDNI